MADTNLNVRIKNAYKTESEWSVTTTIPKNGELLFTKGGLHDGEYKIGDGTHTWSNLDYIKPSYTYPELEPLITKTYNNVICTANSDPAGYLYFMTIKPDNYNTAWTIRYRVHATIAGVTGGYQDSEVLIEGTRNTYLVYNTYNAVNNTSYRPYYSHMYFAANETGQTNNYPHLLGFRFQSSYNPATTANSRTIVIEILEYKNCTPTFLDTMKLFADMPGSNSTNYGNTSSGANATRYSFDGVTQGWTFSGDRNTYPYLLSAYYTKPYAGVNGTKQYSLAMEDSVGRLQSFTTTHGTGTSKAKNTQGFRLGRMYYLNTSGNYTEGQQFGNDVSRVFHPDMDLRYSTNCGTTLTAFKPLYIVGTYNQSDGLFYLADTWWTQTLPTSEDGKIYIYIGCPYDTYRLTFEGYHDPVWYKNNAIRQFIPEATSAVGGAMSSADKTKLNGIATGAEVNQNTFAKVAVGSTTIEADAKQDTLTLAAGSNITITPDATNDKVTIAATDTTYTFTNGLSASGTTVSNSGVRSIGTGSANGTISVNTNGTSADVAVKGLQALAYKASLSKSDVGLGNVDNTSDLNKPLSTATQSALASKLSLTGGTVTGPTDFEDSVSIDDLNVGTMVVTGAASFVNGINANQLTGSIPSALLPSYVDDVLEYNSSANFPTTGEAGKIYVATNTNLTYRWSGSAYVEISPSLALGTTSSTAYRGDYGNTAYAHATDSSRLTTAKSSGFYKIATTAQGHVASVTAVTKGDLTALGVITGGSNAKSAVTISPTTTSVYSMTTDGAVTAGTANVPTKIDTTKFNAGSFTRGTFSQGTLPTLTFSIDANDSGNLKIGFSQGTLPTHAADSYTAPSLGSGFYTAGTANTPTAVTLPTRTQVSGLWNGYNTGVNNTFAAAQTFTGSTT